MVDFTAPDRGDDNAKVETKQPTMKSMHDRITSLETMVESMANHMENSMMFPVARVKPDAPSEPD
jgi:hypothetical protein